MKLAVLVVMLLLSMVYLSTASQELFPQSRTEPGGSIAGQITLHGRPVPGALVSVLSAPPIGRDTVATAKTDANGHYQVANLRAGRYAVVASAPPLVSQEEARGERREISLEPGEGRDHVDFTMIGGGAITGRVADAEGRPVVGEEIAIFALSTTIWRPYYGNHQLTSTDDRGIYRAYGLPPGRYKVSVGKGGGSPYRRLNYEQSYYPQTYYPGVSEEPKAGIIELTEGGEVSNVDITVGKRLRTYEASGRIVEAETGHPQPGINWGYGGNAMSSFGMKSDEGGGFRITGLMPGRYSVFAGCEGDYYSDPVEFEVTDRDLTGLEVRRKRGASISGRVIVDGVSDQAVLSKLSQVSLSARGNTGQVGSSIDKTGAFYFCGLRPGRVRITAESGRQPGFRILRVERHGTELKEGIDVSPGDHVTDVRVVLAYVTGVIRGQVIVEGYALPLGARLQISARRLGDEERASHFFAETDDRGRFIIRGLPSGEYELSTGGTVISSPGTQLPMMLPVKQKVVVTDGAEISVTLVVKVTKR